MEKNKIIKEIEEYRFAPKVEELCKKSISNKSYFKNYLTLDENEKNETLNELIDIIKNCKDENGVLILPEHKIQESKSYPMGIIPNSKKIVDSELGEVTLFLGDGRIYCEMGDNNISSENEMFDCESLIDYSFIIIKDEKSSNETLSNIDTYLKDIKYIKSNKEKIEKYILNTLYKKIIDYVSLKMRKKITSPKVNIKTLKIRLNVELNNNKNDNIKISAIWYNADKVTLNDKKLYYGYKQEKFNVFVNKNNGEMYTEDILSEDDEVIFVSKHKVADVPIILKVYLKNGVKLDAENKEFIDTNIQNIESSIISNPLKWIINKFSKIPIRAICNEIIINSNIVSLDENNINMFITWNESEYFSNAGRFFRKC